MQYSKSCLACQRMHILYFNHSKHLHIYAHETIVCIGRNGVITLYGQRQASARLLSYGMINLPAPPGKTPYR